MLSLPSLGLTMGIGYLLALAQEEASVGCDFHSGEILV
jgi:hypothetical protein